MVSDFVTSEYDTLVFSACLVVASAVAVWRGSGIPALVMLISAVVLFAITASLPFMFGALPHSFADAFGSFPFTIVSRCSKILFGISLVWFILRREKGRGTPTI
ncbi:MAG TPA: hypothetical protein VII34_06390 [Pyrinomonadaceae bacterium]